MDENMDPDEDAQPLLPMQIDPPVSGLLIDCGSQQRKQVERLKRGEGKLTARVQAALFQARDGLGLNAATEIVPVILLYRKSASGYVLLNAPRLRTSDEPPPS